MSSIDGSAVQDPLLTRVTPCPYQASTTPCSNFLLHSSTFEHCSSHLPPRNLLLCSRQNHTHTHDHKHTPSGVFSKPSPTQPHGWYHHPSQFRALLPSLRPVTPLSKAATASSLPYISPFGATPGKLTSCTQFSSPKQTPPVLQGNHPTPPQLSQLIKSRPFIRIRWVGMRRWSISDMARPNSTCRTCQSPPYTSSIINAQYGSDTERNTEITMCIW